MLFCFQSVFDDTGLVVTSESCLDRMCTVGEQLTAYNGDGSLTEAYMTYLDRWQAVRRDLDTMHTQLEELPRQWKLYNQR